MLLVVNRYLPYRKVVRYGTIRILQSIVVKEQLEIVKFDIKTAFLHGELQEEIYLLRPEGDIEKGDIVYNLH